MKLGRIGLAVIASHGGTTGTASCATGLFHRHGLVTRTGDNVVSLVAVVAI